MASLSPLEASWMDSMAEAIMARLQSVPEKREYDRSDIVELVEAADGKGFSVSKFCVGCFLGYSKDKLETELTSRLGPGGTGVMRFKSDRDAYLDVLEEMGLLDAMTLAVNTRPVWTDLLRERLRFGRGSAIQGQQRGRELEDFVEAIIQEVFGNAYEARCTFKGANGEAKCDFAIPSKLTPLILIEAKGYGATGSKMSDIIGDVDAIIGAKRHDASLLLFTDGLTWKSRANDLRKLVQRQNDGRITRIYTKQMREIFQAELEILKGEYGL
ncbi:DpnII family type II restriction endonuclease [Phaeobacter gallaeciensis]|uniref:DpnII family type II restriction endonuclease n=3 Tax=Phaeobacter gallaeciensis TaxID=60890 RepID=A0ABD4XF43_9RHOB|nr:DpnII family type II restriction endonuclease [Phaeobacter gallaeciensis]MDE4144835.1 DpnII family type II restriction endonuclease [Phaeobacter gallaeciensis]MDE4159720.1 DpnII family type II restriction endonuclease [Phaeobacter gallaeciensis]MDE4168178.1 DpnII family type II restriction endonuclease [Phaeobacter gallaeciensis]MDE4169775.1 DpnII family type II restriction endonuclease [Phaeobacter gallaeciensis]MDE4214254.1 DpnII family type II restriction endonuclease [Phaeobacter gallae